MAKTNVILINTVSGLGSESDQVKVAAGYARNYLIPQRLAIPLTSANKRQLDALRKRRTERESRELHSAQELAAALSKLTLVIKVKTGDDGRLFGSVTAANISEELKSQFEASVDRKKIHLPHPLKNVGDHEVELHLHPNLNAHLTVRIESQNPLPTPPPAAEGAGTEESGAKTVRRPKRTTGEDASKAKA